MLTNNELVELYRLEKRDLDDALYGPRFPSFREWKAEYMVEYRQTHITVPVDLADQMIENVLAEADQWLVDATNEEVDKMTNVTAVEIVESNAVPQRAYSDLTDEEREVISANVAAGRPRARKMLKAIGYPLPELKRGRKPNANKALNKIAATPRAESKASKARAYFTANFGTVARKDIVAYFVNELKLTAPGAATYYQKFKTATASN